VVRLVGRAKRNYAIKIKGLEEVIHFLELIEGNELNDFLSELVDKTAVEMMKPGGNKSIKTTKEAGAGHIPVDTGLLKSVFGAVDGKTNDYFVPGGRKRAEQKVYGKPFDSFVIWKKNSKLQRTMGTSLYYAGIVQRRVDFVGAYLRTNIDKIRRYVQYQTNKFIKEIGKKYGFK